MKSEGISFVIPALDEGESALTVVRELIEFMKPRRAPWEVILVDDGSDEHSRKLWAAAAPAMGFRLVRHDSPQGYGASIKDGIRQSRHPWIAITDADGSYPVASFAGLFDRCDQAEMVVGSRQGKVRAIPWMRRPAKWLVNRFASYVARRRIPDVNSGMRVFRRQWVEKYERLLPEGFSLTTTLTIALLRDRAPVEFVPIDYLKRRGRSKIRPLADFCQFIMTILRLSMVFDPLRVVMPIVLASGTFMAASLVRDLLNRNLADTSVFLFLFTMIFLMLGLLADLINRKLPW